MLRCDTSVGSMMRESEYAGSKVDFNYKVAIDQKEAIEALYWLDPLVAIDYLAQEQIDSVNADAVEILKILTSNIKTAQNNSRTN